MKLTEEYLEEIKRRALAGLFDCILDILEISHTWNFFYCTLLVPSYTPRDYLTHYRFKSIMAPRRNRKPPTMIPPRSSNRNPPVFTSPFPPSNNNNNSNHQSPPMMVSPTDSASPPPITSNNNNPPQPMTFSPPTTEPAPPPYESFSYNQHLSRLEQSAEIYLYVASVAPRCSSDGLPRGKNPRRLAQLISNHVEDLCRTMMSTDFDVASRDLVRVTRVAEMLGRWDMDLRSFGRLRELVEDGVRHLSWVYDGEALGRGF